MSPSFDPQKPNTADGTRSFSGRPKSGISRLETRSQSHFPDASTDAGLTTPTPFLTPLPEKYEFRRILGRGGMGEVLHVFDTELQRDVALKFMRRHATTSPKLCQRFLEEARILAQLKHRSVVRVHERGEIEGRPYFAMDYLCGATLNDRRAEFRTSAAVAVAVIVEVAAGVQHAHDHGIFHRDLKASNVVFDGRWPVVTDFGCAKWDQGELSTQGMALFGTPSHMAPEVWEQGSKEHDARADLWSLGVMLYQLLAGVLPFPDDPRTPEGREALLERDPTPIRQCDKVIPGVDERLEQVVLKALGKKPDDRHPTVGAFAAELEEWLATAPAVTETPSTVAETTTAPTRKRRWLWPAVAATVLLTAGVVVAFVLWLKAREDGRPVADCLQNEGDSFTFIRESGLPLRQVGPVEGFRGTVSKGDNGQCELGTAKLYLHELANESLPLPFLFEADVIIDTLDQQTIAGIYAMRKEHRLDNNKPVQVAYFNCFGMGERVQGQRVGMKNNVAACAVGGAVVSLMWGNPVAIRNNIATAGSGVFAPTDGTIDADTNTSFDLLTGSWQKITPPEPVAESGKPEVVRHLVIEVSDTGCRAFRDGKPCGQLDFANRRLDGMLNLHGVIPDKPTLGSGYGLFVVQGGARFTNVRLVRPASK